MLDQQLYTFSANFTLLKTRHYEAQLHSGQCKRVPQQAKIRFVAESAALLLFFDLLAVLDSFQKQIPKTLYRSKLLQK